MRLIIDGSEITKPKKKDDDIFASPEGITPVTELGDLGNALHQLNDDTLDPETKMSNIDMKSRLAPLQINGLTVIDALVAFRFLPVECDVFSRKVKRLWVSESGKGRAEITSMVVGQREHVENSASGLSKLRGLFGGGVKNG